MRAYRYMADQYEDNAEPDLELYAHYGHTIYAHKASEGDYHIDSAHARRIRRAHLEGLTCVHYHFARPDLGLSMRREAALFWGVVKPTWQAGDYLAIDLERSKWAGLGATGDYLHEFATLLEGATGHTPLDYADTNYLRNLGQRNWLSRQRIWQADYNLTRGKLPWWRPVWACQFTDGVRGAHPHRLAGIGECDVSLLRLDVALALNRRFRRRRRQLKQH